jgi:hypothetical protein
LSNSSGDQQHWRQVREVFNRACDVSGEARQTLLSELCTGQSAALRADVDKLLALHREPMLSLDQPLLAAPTPRTAGAGDSLAGGRYRLTQYLASGGMGEVFSAVDTQSGSPVAVKLLRNFSLVARDREQARARFQREASLAGKIDHPNVCRVLAVFMDEAGTRPSKPCPWSRESARVWRLPLSPSAYAKSERPVLCRGTTLVFVRPHIPIGQSQARKRRFASAERRFLCTLQDFTCRRYSTSDMPQGTRTGTRNQTMSIYC